MGYDALGAVSSSAASRYGVFTRKQAASLGLTDAAIRRHLAHGVVVQLHPSVLAFSSVRPCWRQAFAAAQLAGGGHGRMSHRAAGRLHGLDGLGLWQVPELSSTKRLKLPDAIVHRVATLDPCDLVIVDGIPATGLARTLCDLGSVLPPDALEQAIDSARRRGTSLRWLRETAERLHRPGQSGTGAVLRQLEQIRPGERVRGSWFERTIELLLADPRIPPLARQYDVRDASGRVIARPDLAIPSIRLAIEGHSREFHFGRAAEGADEDRDHRLAVVGWDTLYLGYQSTRRPKDTAQLVAETVAERSLLFERRGEPGPQTG